MSLKLNKKAVDIILKKKKEGMDAVIIQQALKSAGITATFPEIFSILDEPPRKKDK